LSSSGAGVRARAGIELQTILRSKLGSVESGASYANRERLALVAAISVKPQLFCGIVEKDF
jgi:hypothetical protein